LEQWEALEAHLFTSDINDVGNIERLFLNNFSSGNLLLILFSDFSSDVDLFRSGNLAFGIADKSFEFFLVTMDVRVVDPSSFVTFLSILVDVELVDFFFSKLSIQRFEFLTTKISFSFLLFIYIKDSFVFKKALLLYKLEI